MSKFNTTKTIGVCLDKVLQYCGSEARQGSTYLDVHFSKPFLEIELHNTTDSEVMESVRDYCYEVAGKFREAGMNIQKQLNESDETKLSELISHNVHFTI